MPFYSTTCYGALCVPSFYTSLNCFPFQFPYERNGVTSSRISDELILWCRNVINDWTDSQLWNVLWPVSNEHGNVLINAGPGNRHLHGLTVHILCSVSKQFISLSRYHNETSIILNIKLFPSRKFLPFVHSNAAFSPKLIDIIQ